MSDIVVAWMWYVGYCCILDAVCRYWCIRDAACCILLYPGFGMSDIFVSEMWRLWINQGLIIHRQWKHTQKTEHMITYSLTQFFQFTHFLIAWPFKCGRTFYVCLVISWRWRLTWKALPCENVPLRNRPNPFEFLINSGPQRLVVPNMYEYLRLTSDIKSTGFESGIASRWPLWAAEFTEHFYTVIYSTAILYSVYYNSVIYCCTAIYSQTVLFCF